MAPNSKSRKPSSALKAKSTSSTTKQKLLKGMKQAASPRMKENIKKAKQNPGKDRKPAIFSSGKENYEVQMKKLKAENDSLRKTLAVKDRAPATTAILRPERGASGTGFNLQVVMGLADDGETYAILRRTVRDLAAKGGLDCEVVWNKQPKDIISKIIGMARERHTYFKKFPHGWAIEEFLKTHLKNKRAYARKRGYLGDRTNQGADEDRAGSDQSSESEESESDNDEHGDGTGDKSGPGDEDQGGEDFELEDGKQGDNDEDDIYEDE